MVEELKEIIDYYGVKKQVPVYIEEMSELTKEICKYQRKLKFTDNTKEEITDVQICLDQLKIILNYTEEEQEKNYKYKVNRQLERIKDEKQSLEESLKQYEEQNQIIKSRDVNYLDAIHHKTAVFDSLGRTIEHPEQIWVERAECFVYDILGRKMNLDLIPIPDDEDEQEFITLKDISDLEPNGHFKAICESPLGGVIYAYNNYGQHEWILRGIMNGYA